MTYQEASKIGTVCEGYIRCTYALVCTAPSRQARIWSLQKGDMSMVNAAKEDLNASISGRSMMMMELPIVTAKDIQMRKDWIKVRLTDEALESIIDHCVPEKVAVEWKVYFVYAKKKGGDRQYQYTTTKDPGSVVWGKTALGYYTAEVSKYATNIKGVEDAEKKFGKEFYVQEALIDWVPVNADKIKAEVYKDGRVVELNTAIQAAKKKLDNAKAILAMASVTMII